MSKARVAVLHVISGQLSVTRGGQDLWLISPASAPAAQAVSRGRPGGRRCPLATPDQQPSVSRRRRHRRNSAVARTPRRPRTRRRAAHPAVAPAPGRPAGALDLDDPAHPAPPRADHPAATQTPPQLLSPASKPPNPTNAGNPISPTGSWPTAAKSRSSTGSTITPDTCCPPPPTTRGRPRRGRQLHRHRQHPRPTGLHVDRQRFGLHRTIHPRPQRIRTTPAQPGHHPKERPPRPPPNPRQNRTLPPNPQTLADPTTPTNRPRRHSNPTRHLPRHLQHRAPPPRPTATHHPRTGLHRPTQSHPTRHRAHRTLPHPPRHRRSTAANSPCATPAAYITSASAPPTPAPKSSSSSPPPPSPSSTNPTTTHRQPPHRPRPQLLAQPTKTPRPMAGAICNR